MKELKWPIVISSVTSFADGTISWLIGSPVWTGALIGFSFPAVFFAGAILAVIGMFKVVEDYLREQSR